MAVNCGSTGCHKPTILVTGGAGYVGSHTVVELLNNNYQVVVVDNLVNSSKDDEPNKIPECLRRVEAITGKKCTFYQIDILDKENLNKVFLNHKIHVVMHFAALKAVGESCQIPLTYYKNNVGGSCTLLEVMKAHQVTQFIYSSSATVYGTPQHLPLTEEHPTGQGCTNPYGKTKYFVEEMLKDLSEAEKGWSIISLRYFNPVGAHASGNIGEDPQGIPNNLMPFIAQVAVGRQKLLKVYGSDYDTPDGTGVRDYIHITDLAEGHIAALKKLDGPPLKFKPYNLGTGCGYSVLEMIAAFSKAAEKEIPYEIVERRPGDIAYSYADASLAKKELGWQASKELDDMCKDMWRWQSQNPNGFRPS